MFQRVDVRAQHARAERSSRRRPRAARPRAPRRAPRAAARSHGSASPTPASSAARREIASTTALRRRANDVTIISPTDRREHRQHADDVLVRRRAEDQRRSIRPLRAQVIRERACAGGVVRRIEQQLGARCERHAFETAAASAPRARPVSIAAPLDRQAERVELLEQPDRDDGVGDLVQRRRARASPVRSCASASMRARSAPPAAGRPRRTHSTPSAAWTSGRPDRVARRARSPPAARPPSRRRPSARPARAMPAFSPAIAAGVVAELPHVIEVDRDDRRGHRRHDVGRVEAAAEADLEHRDVDRRPLEDLEARPPSSPRRTWRGRAAARRRGSRLRRRARRTTTRSSVDGVDGRAVEREALRQIRRDAARCSGRCAGRPRAARARPSRPPIPCRWCRR